MSRSRRKTPVAGITTADSDSAFKAREHRKAHRAIKSTDLTECDPPHDKQFGDPWSSDKDGKARFDPKEHPGLMRK